MVGYLFAICADLQVSSYVTTNIIVDFSSVLVYVKSNYKTGIKACKLNLLNSQMFVFTISSILWGVLGGVFVAVVALIASTLDSSIKAQQTSSRISSFSSSRKLEFISLLIPTISVISLNQLVLPVSTPDVCSVISDIAGIQWSENREIYTYYSS